MRIRKPQDRFETVYGDTYDHVLKYIVFRCNHLDDVNDIIQETYFELFKMMKKQEIKEPRPYIIGIAKNKLKKYYSWKSRLRETFTSKSSDEPEIVNLAKSDINLEEEILEKITAEEIWAYLGEKNGLIAKIFYLYYTESATIKEIARGLGLNESTVKNHLYRTLKELRVVFGKERN